MHSRSLPGGAARSLERLRFHAERTTPPRAERWLQCETVWRRSWRFADAEAAERWNAAWERALEQDRIHPAFGRIAGQPIREPLIEGLASLAGSVLLEDFRAGSPHPVALPGGRYDLAIRFSLQRARRGADPGPLLLRLHGDVVGRDGEVQWSSYVVRTFGPEVVPAALVCLWHARRWEETVEPCESRGSSD